MKNTITRSQIKRVEKKLRRSNPEIALDPKDLYLVNSWRNHHNTSLKYLSKTIFNEASKHKETVTLTQRLKRVYSIILKLKRFENMQLSMMEDIAGMRIVVESTTSALRLSDLLKQRKSKHTVTKVNNYISSPKEDGYRSLHLIYKIDKDPSHFIELQIRTELQHIWATGVEVLGTLEKTSFKTGQGNQKWKDFFSLLSSYFAIVEKSPVLQKHEILSKDQLKDLLIKTIKQMNIIEKLNAYTSIYSSDWQSKRPKGRTGRYALVVLDTRTNTTRVTTFSESKLSIALDEYAAIEKDYHSSSEVNAVLVNLKNMDELESAYPNYFMNTEKLTQLLSKIILGDF